MSPVAPLGHRMLHQRETPQVGDTVWSPYFGCWLRVERIEKGPGGSVLSGTWWFRRMKNGQPWGMEVRATTRLGWFVRNGLVARKA